MLVLTVNNLEVRAGARLLLEPVSFPVNPGDKIGLVGRNGAGKTTLTRILAGEGIPAAGTVTRTGAVGYLPQDPRAGDLEVLTRNRILSARGLDTVLERLERYSVEMADAKNPSGQERAMTSYARAEAELLAAGGYGAEAEAARIAANLGLPERVLSQPLGTLSGGSGAGWNWRGSCSLAPTRCCWMSPPTTWTQTRWFGCAAISRIIPVAW